MGIFNFLKNKGTEAAAAAGQKAIRLENGDLVEAVVFGSVMMAHADEVMTAVLTIAFADGDFEESERKCAEKIAGILNVRLKDYVE